ncbi:MAG: hypothetical protein FWD57_17320 [Polyangiaceae bacterium]|nr:hypothetical protein [Polyangiaceae bacterium]
MDPMIVVGFVTMSIVARPNEALQTPTMESGCALRSGLVAMDGSGECVSGGGEGSARLIRMRARYHHAILQSA